jgi:chromosome segregation ATPase
MAEPTSIGLDSSVQTATPAPDETSPSGEAAPKPEPEEPAAPAKPAAKPRRRSPAKPKQSRAKSPAKSAEQAPGRFEREDGAAELVRTVTVDATALLAQVGQLTEQLVRTRITLESTTADRDALAAELASNREKHSDAERKAEASEAARVQAEEELSRARKETAALTTDLEDAQRRADEVKHQLNLTWNQLKGADTPAPPPEADWRSRWRLR